MISLLLRAQDKRDNNYQLHFNGRFPGKPRLASFFLHLYQNGSSGDKWHSFVQAGWLSCHTPSSVPWRALKRSQSTDPKQAKSPTGLTSILSSHFIHRQTLKGNGIAALMPTDVTTQRKYSLPIKTCADSRWTRPICFTFTSIVNVLPYRAAIVVSIFVYILSVSGTTQKLQAHRNTSHNSSGNWLVWSSENNKE